MKPPLLLILCLAASSAVAAPSLTQSGNTYTLKLDYIEVKLGLAKAAYTLNLRSTDLQSFTPDLSSLAAVSINADADPAVTPVLTQEANGFLLKIPALAVGSSNYSVAFTTSNFASLAVSSATAINSSAIPTAVSIAAVNSQTAGTRSFASSTQLGVSWSAPAGVKANSYKVTANEVGGTSSISKTSSTTSTTLSGLKAGSRYAINVSSCLDDTCTNSATASAVFSTQSEEHWQLQGTGNSYSTLTKANTDGNSLSWVFRWGADAGSSYAGRYQYYYKTSGSFASGRTGIGISNTAGSGTDVATLSSFAPVTSAGLRNPCDSPNSLTDCPSTAAYFIDAVQAVPLKSGQIRAFFEATDATDKTKTTKIFSLDSQDGYVGQDFNLSSAQSFCGGKGSKDYGTGGNCEFKLVLGSPTDTAAPSPLSKARQFKIGWDWLADWRWDAAVGTFMVITGADSCGQTSNGLFYASWDGSKWNVLRDAAGCAKPLTLKAHGPVLVPLGGAAFKLYYEDETNGPQSGKPLRLVYSDGSKTGTSTIVDYDDWEPSSAAREVHFLWPDGSLLDAADEAGLGDHMVLVPSSLDKQYMFVNLGGFDNSKTPTTSNGLGVATLLNP